MMNEQPIRTLIVSADQGLVEQILKALAPQDDFAITGIVQDLEDAIAHVQEVIPDIILVGESLEGEEERLRRLAIQAPFASVIALCPRESILCAQRALLAGARAFVPTPFSDEELCTVLREVYTVEAERRRKLGQAPTQPMQALETGEQDKVFALLSPKGGAGRSVIAANLAILLHQETDKEVLLIEAHQSVGDLDTMLNLVPTSTLADLGPDTRDVDEDLLRSILIQHASGIQVLLTPSKNDDHRLPDPSGFGRILQLAKETFDYVVIDTGPLADPYTGVVLQHADRVLLVITPEVPSLHRAAVFLEAALENGFPPDRIQLVVNRSTARGGIGQQDIQDRLQISDPFLIPEDISLVTYSVNQGIPVALSHPKSAVTTSLFHMAQKLVNGTTQLAKTSLPAKGWSKRLPKPLRGLLSHA